MAVSVTDLEAELQRALVEKGSLLKEVHHRVKNHLQVLDSLLRLQADAFADARVRQAITDAANRVQVIAQIHQLLYGSADLANLEIEKFLKLLCTTLASMFPAGMCPAQILMDIEPLNLDLQRAVPLGLIFNELISNAFKHAFPQGRTGTIRIRLRKEGNSLVVDVRDDGVGLPQPLPTTSLGLQLIQVLTEQLRGTVQFESAGGVRVSMRFPSDQFQAMGP